MPRLSGEELSRLYPKAKTYDEIKNEHSLIQEARRPKFVSLKIALWTASVVPVVLSVYHIILRLIIGIEPGSVTGALFGVCFSILTGVIGLAVIYYLYSLIDGVTAKIFATTTPLYLALALSLCLAGAFISLLYSWDLPLAVIFAASTTLTFILSFAFTHFINRYD